MTKTSKSLAELLEKPDERDFLRTVAEAMLQLLMRSTSKVSLAPGGTSARRAALPGATAAATGRSTPGSGREPARAEAKARFVLPDLPRAAPDITRWLSLNINRRITGDWRYLWLDATYLKVRHGGRIVSDADIIAVAVNTTGRREIIGLGTA